MTLSQNQKKYRARKEKESKDFHRVNKGEGKQGIKIGTKQLSVRVSTAAYEKLKAHAADFNFTLSEMLSHIIKCKARKDDGQTYVTYKSGINKTDPYYWDKTLLEESRSGRRKVGKQDRRLALPVTSTAFKSLPEPR